MLADWKQRLSETEVRQIARDWLTSKGYKLKRFSECEAVYEFRGLPTREWMVVFEVIPPTPDGTLFIHVDDVTGNVKRHHW